MRENTFKVLSYNIHKGFTATNRRFVLRRIREVLEITDADVVFLQEVLGEHRGHAARLEEWPAQPQFEYIADRLWPHFAYGMNAVYTAGHHGNAILSKHGIAWWENIDVSTNALEKRGLLHAVVKPPGFVEEVHLICLHLDLLERGRVRQIENLCKRVCAVVPASAPLVIAGDFNDWQHRCGDLLEESLGLMEVHKAIHGHCARSFPSWLPMLRLDRIYVRGFVPKVAECFTGRPWSELSDHTPLFAEIIRS